jgi:alpha/beta superfamily hydrolase
MARRMESLMLAGPAGRLEALLEEPEDRDPGWAALVCHPHPKFGGTMHNKVVHRLARGFRAAGGVVLRFNFRGVNLSQGTYDHGIGELEDARAAFAFLRERYPELPYLLAGFSFGSRIAQKLGCTDAGVRKIVVTGFPAAGSEAGEYLHCGRPRVFLQSTNDEHGPAPQMQSFYDRATGEKQLIWIEARDHFFAGALDQLEAAAARIGAE